MPVLAVVGITPTGTREVLAFVTGDRENESAWTDLLDDLQRRGLQTVGLWITDGNQAMLDALAAKFATTPRQRCVKHKHAIEIAADEAAALGAAKQPIGLTRTTIFPDRQPPFSIVQCLR